ncbi:antitoxin AF2212-like protein [Thermococcus sp.]
MEVIEAIYENGILKPLKKPNLREKEKVILVIREKVIDDDFITLLEKLSKKFQKLKMRLNFWRNVLDANILIDALFEKNEERRNLALKLFQAIKGKTVYVPRIFIVEVISIAKRLGIGLSSEELFTLVERFNIKKSWQFT